MGIASFVIDILNWENGLRPFHGSVLTLGVQSISGRPEGHGDDIDFFKKLGFDTVKRMDISAYEGAEIVFDLNHPDPPAECLGAYDCIVDGGTLEHVFNVPNAFNNIFKMLKVGGRVLHFVASNGYIDHGFYMFSPILLDKFYKANKYDILLSQLTHETALNRYLECFIAEKNGLSTGDKTPYQIFG